MRLQGSLVWVTKLLAPAGLWQTLGGKYPRGHDAAGVVWRSQAPGQGVRGYIRSHSTPWKCCHCVIM